MLVCGRGVAGEVFAERERDHFARDFGKPLRASADEHVAVGIKGHDVTRVVPAGPEFCARRLKHPGSAGAQIPAHHVGAADLETAAVGDAGHRHHSALDAGQQSADAAVAIVSRRVDRQYWRGFGAPVALQDVDAELALPARPQLWR